MNGCTWEEKRKQVSHIKTEMGRILKKDNEVSVYSVCTCVQYGYNIYDIKASLLKAIKDEEVFGFIKCDINSPDEMIKRHLRTGFLFPPVISKQVIEDDMLSPYMKEVIAKRKKQPKVYPILIHHLNNISV